MANSKEANVLNVELNSTMIQHRKMKLYFRCFLSLPLNGRSSELPLQCFLALELSGGSLKEGSFD